MRCLNKRSRPSLGREKESRKLQTKTPTASCDVIIRAVQYSTEQNSTALRQARIVPQDDGAFAFTFAPSFLPLDLQNSDHSAILPSSPPVARKRPRGDHASA